VRQWQENIRKTRPAHLRTDSYPLYLATHAHWHFRWFSQVYCAFCFFYLFCDSFGFDEERGEKRVELQ
jgi:hypothetical protein